MDRFFGGKPVTPLPGFSTIKVFGMKPAGAGRTEIFFIFRSQKFDLIKSLMRYLEESLCSPCTLLRKGSRDHGTAVVMWSRIIKLQKGGLWNYKNVQQLRFNNAVLAAEADAEQRLIEEMDYYATLDQGLLQSIPLQ